MFQHLPKVTEASYQTFVDRELLEVLNNVNELMDELREHNNYLAQGITGGAWSVAEDFEGETKEMVVSEAVVCQLMVLRLIDRALEAQKMEVSLSQKTSSSK